VAIAHFRAKENMFRLDPLPVTIQDQIKQEVENDRKRTYGDLLKKYDKLFEEAKAAAEAYNKATELIRQKEEEKAKIRAENKVAIDKLNADKNAEIERLKKEAADKVELAKEAQRQEYISYMIKALVGVGILFLIAAGLMKSITIATAPAWVIGTVVGVTILSMVGVAVYTKTKQNKQAIPSPAPVVVPAEAAPAPVRRSGRRRAR
jgi:vacuolar-type H+-ATPase subunit I/STV1